MARSSVRSKLAFGPASSRYASSIEPGNRGRMPVEAGVGLRMDVQISPLPPCLEPPLGFDGVEVPGGRVAVGDVHDRHRKPSYELVARQPCGNDRVLRQTPNQVPNER